MSSSPSLNLNKISYDSNMFIKHNGKKLIMRTPPMRMPFGYEDYYGKIMFKLEFSNIDHDPIMQSFYNNIMELEQKNMEYFSNDEKIITENEYKSCVFKNEHTEYPPLLIVKVEQRRNKPICTIIDNGEYSARTIYDFKKSDKVIAEVVFERLWRYDKSKGKSCGMLVKVNKFLCV